MSGSFTDERRQRATRSAAWTAVAVAGCAVLLDWTAVGGVPATSDEVPVINYWRFGNVAPSGTTAVRISSFTWTPLGR